MIKQICPACVGFHVVAISVSFYALYLESDRWKRPLIAGSLTVLFIGLAQVYGPSRKTHLIERLPPSKGKNAQIQDLKLSPWDRSELEVCRELHPMIGNESAPLVVVEVFDYQCMACRRVARYFEDFIGTHPDDVCLILVPFPLNRQCNPAMPSGTRDQRGACAMAKAALAVWRGKPKEFEAFHNFLIKQPDEEGATQRAIDLLGNDLYRQIMSDLENNDVFSTNIELWRKLSSGKSGRLPKLWISDEALLHGAPSSAEMFNKVMADQVGIRKR